MGLGVTALGSLLPQNGAARQIAGDDRGTHRASAAKRVIFLFMAGAPSQLELFDYKPDLERLDGTDCPKEFLEGKRETFDLDLDLRGTSFQAAVYEVVCSIPYGEISTYGEVAATVGRPKAVRAVGAANGQNPISVIIPCHRVLGKNGDLTGYGGGLDMKRRLLELERCTNEDRSERRSVIAEVG